MGAMAEADGKISTKKPVSKTDDIKMRTEILEAVYHRFNLRASSPENSSFDTFVSVRTSLSLVFLFSPPQP